MLGLLVILMSIGLACGGAAPGEELRADEADREAILEAREEAIIDSLVAIEEQIEQFGGLEAMYETVAPLAAEVERIMDASPPGTRTVPVGDNRHQGGIMLMAVRRFRFEDKGNPIDVIRHFHQLLQDRGIDLIVVPVPAKMEHLVEDFETELPEGHPASPGRLEVMLELLEADVEVVDVLPMLREAQIDAPLPLYEKNGHHLSGYGVKLAGEFVAQRLQRYEFADADPERFVEQRRTSVERVDHSVPMKAWQVRDAETGEPYLHLDDQPVVVIGDSQAFAYFTASWASHIAKALGMPISDLSESNGGATAHNKLARLGTESLDRRKVVIWIFTSVSLLAPMDWEETPLYETPDPWQDPKITRVLANMDQFEALRRTDPTVVVAEPDDLLELGAEMMGIGQVELALRVLRNALLMHPRSAALHLALGEACARAKQTTEAIAALEKGLELDPEAEGAETSRALLQKLRSSL